MCVLWTKSILVVIVYTVTFLVILSPHVESIRKRISNGIDAEQSDFKYHVSIQLNGGHMCGGAIISDQFILTAAHCFFDKGCIRSYDSPLTVKSGTNNLTEPGFVSDVEKIMVLLDYLNMHSYNNPDIADIAVLKLKEKLNLNGHNIEKINLPNSIESDPSIGDIVTAAGYGLTEEAIIQYDGEKMQIDGTPSVQLKTIKTLVVDPINCPINYNSSDTAEKHICTYVPRRDNDSERYGECYGDSGSPLAYKNTVVGVVSSGSLLCGNHNASTIYTRVSYYLNFIDNAMNDLPNGEMVIYKKADHPGKYYWS